VVAQGTFGKFAGCGTARAAHKREAPASLAVLRALYAYSKG